MSNTETNICSIKRNQYNRNEILYLRRILNVTRWVDFGNGIITAKRWSNTTVVKLQPKKKKTWQMVWLRYTVMANQITAGNTPSGKRRNIREDRRWGNWMKKVTKTLYISLCVINPWTLWWGLIAPHNTSLCVRKKTKQARQGRRWMKTSTNKKLNNQCCNTK